MIPEPACGAGAPSARRRPAGVAVEVSNRQRRLTINTHLLAEAAALALQSVRAANGQLSIVLVDDAAMAKLNAKYHGVRGPTDVLSFDYGAGQGELILSVPRAISHARRFRTTPARELILYLVHGILHLHGFDDRTVAKRRRMRAAERRMMVWLRKRVEIHDLTRHRTAK
jgi:probable rRNA maturation factor